METENKLPWYVREESDNTVKLIGGLILFAAGMVGLFFAEMIAGDFKQPVYLKEGIIHAIFSFIAGWIAGSQKKGEHPERDEVKPMSEKTKDLTDEDYIKIGKGLIDIIREAFGITHWSEIPEVLAEIIERMCTWRRKNSHPWLDRSI